MFRQCSLGVVDLFDRALRRPVQSTRHLIRDGLECLPARMPPGSQIRSTHHDILESYGHFAIHRVPYLARERLSPRDGASACWIGSTQLDDIAKLSAEIAQ